MRPPHSTLFPYTTLFRSKVSAKKEADREARAAVSEEKRHAKEVEDEYKKKTDELREQLTEALSNILLGEKIPLDVVRSEEHTSELQSLTNVVCRLLLE